jgi:tetratricopeptide (TPR) repeat protein
LIRTIFTRTARVVLSSSLLLLASCDYSAPPSLSPTQGVSIPVSASPASPTGTAAPRDLTQSNPDPKGQEERTAILDSVMTLIQRAALQPGNENFKLAIQKLNHYFVGTTPSSYRLDSESREFLRTQLPPGYANELESQNWTLRDARHVEDCMMYYGIATRVAGSGSQLERVQRLFEWVVQQIQLVPRGALSSARLPQAIARPYDVLLRGMATEADGSWAERTWLFMALCRQIGVDTGLITYTRSDTLDSRFSSLGFEYELESRLLGLRHGPKMPVVWICTAVIDDEAYLFDARIGLKIPGPGGLGVATLEQALEDSKILERMNLPGHSPYGTSRASLVGSPTRIGLLIDSAPGYFATKMRLLQRELAGKNRTILFRDAAEQRNRFASALGHRLGAVSLWGLPLEVQTRLFTDSRYVEALQASLYLFRQDFPLLYARVKQLRGEFDEATEAYVRFRFAENAPQVIDKKKPIPKDIQEGLDVYSTYYLALTHLERNNLDKAEMMLKKLLEILPEPGPNRPYYSMFRWGANANLARIAEARKDTARAVAYATQNDPTPQYIGNLLRAREMIWNNPIAGAFVTLPPAPEPTPHAPLVGPK